METIMVSMETSAGLHCHLGFWLRRVSNQVTDGFTRALQERKLSVAEWVALSQIAADAKTHPAGIAAATGMTRGAISKVLDKLEHRKWIGRAVSEEDNRVQRPWLTRKGRQLLPELTRIADSNDLFFFGALDAREQALL